ncbi:MAG: DUF1549 domain-containing protein [Planctomycetia bacterium]
MPVPRFGRFTLPRPTLPAVALVVLSLLVGAAASDPLAVRRRARPPSPGTDRSAGVTLSTDATVVAIDRLLAENRRANGVEAAAAADNLTILRRLWLALAATLPSLEEIRSFEADTAPGAVDRALATLLADRRSADALARRLASPLVGDEKGEFIVFRRDRFTTWLADQIGANRPWDQTVREMVSARGLWTDTPAVNFITQAAANGVIDADKLAGRVSRVFLGARLDCAQCHDHPFAAWKQGEFEGLAASFAQAKLSPVGVEDDPARVHRIDRTSVAALATAMTGAGRNVPPRVPFGAEWLGSGGTHRENLAAWVIHTDNRRFDRAIANRMWSLLFGTAWHEPVDDIPEPGPTSSPDDLLDLLADDFREHGRDLHRLVKVIAATEAFRFASTHPDLGSAEGAARVKASWGAFPLTRLNPEQMIGAMAATTSLQTFQSHSHLLTRAIRFFRETDFLREYGQVVDSQGGSLPATIPQALVQMNGKLAREMVEANVVTATGRIAGMAHDDVARLELAFLVALTRRPTSEERESLLPLITLAESKGRGLEDVMWTLFNCPEFSWNH